MRAVPGELKGTGYEIFVAVLSILSIVNLALGYAFRGDQDLLDVLLVVNALLRAIFLGDFVYRLVTAPARSAYFLPALRLGGPAGQRAGPGVQGPPHLPAAPGLPAARHARRPSRPACPRPGPRRQRAAHAPARRHPDPRVRQPADPPPRGERTGRRHHDRLRRPVVHDRDDLHRGVRRPVPGDQCRTRRGHPHRRRRHRHLRDVHRLPRQGVPRPRREDGEESGVDVTVAAAAGTTQDVETLDELRELVARPDVSLGEVDRLLARRRADGA